MSAARRILVLGGYGGFGARISLRLAQAGHPVTVAGRSLTRAEAFCAGRSGLTPLRLDREVGLEAALMALRPWAVVDAAGPFQASDPVVPRAAIAAGSHYVDIADARDFVTGIGALDPEARAAGVVVLSGASSVPALSGAVAAALARGLTRISAVEMAISASSRGTTGASVARAILSYVGRPIRLWRGGRWDQGHGWQSLRRQDYAVAGSPPVKGRFCALCETPDLDLLPDRLPGRPAVSFRAGAESALQTLGLWLLSWPIRWRWIRSALSLAPLLAPLQRWSSGFGGDRSAMIVRLFGLGPGGDRLERRWTLLAEQRAGPEMPSLAAPIALGHIADDRLAPGAYDAGGRLELADFTPAFAAMTVAHEALELSLPPPLYERVMGEAFHRLPPAVRSMHAFVRDGGAAGMATVTRGTHPVARLVATVVGFPTAGEHRLHVHFSERGGVETWVRDFAGRKFVSRLSERRGRLVERFGPAAFAMDLPGDPDGLAMHIRRWWFGPIPMPMAFAPRSVAREWEEGGRFHFDVPITLPGLGLLVHYRGWLAPIEPQA